MDYADCAESERPWKTRSCGMSLSNLSLQGSGNPVEEESRKSVIVKVDGRHQENKALEVHMIEAPMTSQRLRQRAQNLHRSAPGPSVGIDSSYLPWGNM